MRQFYEPFVGTDLEVPRVPMVLFQNQWFDLVSYDAALFHSTMFMCISESYEEINSAEALQHRKAAPRHVREAICGRPSSSRDHDRHVMRAVFILAVGEFLLGDFTSLESHLDALAAMTQRRGKQLSPVLFSPDCIERYAALSAIFAGHEGSDAANTERPIRHRSQRFPSNDDPSLFTFADLKLTNKWSSVVERAGGSRAGSGISADLMGLLVLIAQVIACWDVVSALATWGLETAAESSIATGKSSPDYHVSWTNPSAVERAQRLPMPTSATFQTTLAALRNGALALSEPRCAAARAVRVALLIYTAMTPTTPNRLNDNVQGSDEPRSHTRAGTRPAGTRSDIRGPPTIHLLAALRDHIRESMTPWCRQSEWLKAPGGLLFCLVAAQGTAAQPLSGTASSQPNAHSELEASLRFWFQNALVRVLMTAGHVSGAATTPGSPCRQSPPGGTVRCFRVFGWMLRCRAAGRVVLPVPSPDPSPAPSSSSDAGSDEDGDATGR